MEHCSKVRNKSVRDESHRDEVAQAQKSAARVVIDGAKSGPGGCCGGAGVGEVDRGCLDEGRDGVAIRQGLVAESVVVVGVARLVGTNDEIVQTIVL